MHTVFIFSFTRYIQWPDTYNGGDFEILVLGDSPIVEELKSMAQVKKVGDRTIKVTKINNVSEIRKCNILFIPAAKSPQIAEVLAKITTQSILVVSEEQGLGAKGSNVNFVTKDGKLAFELNQGATTKQGLKVSNELSRLAILI
jgi:nitrogen regulatory protein PII